MTLLALLGLLCWEFFKTGLFAVGGGMATLPFLYDISARTGWFTTADIANLVAISESTPGPLGINMSTYVGFTSGSEFGFGSGILGAVLAPLAEVLPSLIISMLLIKVLERFKKNQLVQDVFYGLRPASVGLIAAAGIQVFRITFLTGEGALNLASLGSFLSTVRWPCLALGVLLFFLTRKFKKVHPIFFILASAGVGIAFGALGWI